MLSPELFTGAKDDKLTKAGHSNLPQYTIRKVNSYNNLFVFIDSSRALFLPLYFQQLIQSYLHF